MIAPELSRPVKLKGIQNEPVVVEANESERAALARRFNITSIENLRAVVALDPGGDTIKASGSLTARITQACAISGEDFPVAIEENLDFVFVPASSGPPVDAAADIEIELEDDELDEIEYSGDSFDVGEAVAQSLALAIDPYAEGPNADAARKSAGISSDDEPSGPLAEALSALKKN
ncbi:MAG: DUF177 domain-containing protein [Erythrobacter sp.]|nr:DUF177 domain-containing protein [Erythrobacter sp.]